MPPASTVSSAASLAITACACSSRQAPTRARRLLAPERLRPPRHDRARAAPLRAGCRAPRPVRADPGPAREQPSDAPRRPCRPRSAGALLARQSRVHDEVGCGWFAGGRRARAYPRAPRGGPACGPDRRRPAARDARLASLDELRALADGRPLRRRRRRRTGAACPSALRHAPAPPATRSSSLSVRRVWSREGQRPLERACGAGERALVAVGAERCSAWMPIWHWMSLGAQLRHHLVAPVDLDHVRLETGGLRDRYPAGRRRGRPSRSRRNRLRRAWPRAAPRPAQLRDAECAEDVLSR